MALNEAPFGTYNVTNPNPLTTKEITKLIAKHGLKKEFKFFKSNAAFLKTVRTPRSNCTLDTSKLLKACFKMRPTAESIEDALKDAMKIKIKPAILSKPIYGYGYTYALT
jgi:hypothetical protein